MDTHEPLQDGITSEEVAEIVRAVKRRNEALFFLRERERELERELELVRGDIAELERFDAQVRPDSESPAAAASAEGATAPASVAERVVVSPPMPTKPAKPRPQKPPAERPREAKPVSARRCANCRQPGHQARTCKAPTLASASLIEGHRVRTPSSTEPRLVKTPKASDLDPLPG